MSALERLAHSKGRRDEVPNQELARDLAAKKDRAGIREIAANLSNPDKDIQADCVKVLYEVGYIAPALIADYAEDFLKLLHSRNNRLVWGGMIALGTVASLKADLVFAHRAEIEKVMDEGSVITMDNGVLALARAAAKNEKYNKAIFPYLLNHLKTCRLKEVPQHAEKTLPAVNATNRTQFAAVVTKRMKDLSGSAVTRLTKVLREAEAR
jgi:hypothetical protein